MDEERIQSEAAMTAATGPSIVQAFRTRLRGELVEPDHPAYDHARQVYNAMIDKRPALIARCVDVADVIASVDSARAGTAPRGARRTADPGSAINRVPSCRAR